MISNILVATDGSDTARRAIDVAAELASGLAVPLSVGHVLQHGAKVEELRRLAESEHLVQHASTETRQDITDIPSNLDAISAGRLTDADKERIIAAIGDEIVARAAQRAKDAGAREVSTCVVNGDYADGILEMAKEVGADTIVIGRRGLGSLQQMFQGSVSQKVSQQAEGTVVIVR